MKIKHQGLSVLLLALCTTGMLAAEQPESPKPDSRPTAVTHPELKAFPQAKAGMERFVIVLPHKERGEEDAFRVELIAGKIMETDGVNLVRLGSSLQEKTLEGWAYPFYEIKDGPAMQL
jgi:ecotin